MGNSISSPSGLPAGALQHAASGSKLRVYWSGGTLRHALEERGLSADYPVAYTVGAGKVGQSFLIEMAGHLFQSPVSFYTAKNQWDVSPGYETEKLLDFNRSITSDCLFCHSNSVKETATATELAPISCERCHGPAQNHLKNPVSGSMVNPAKLSGRERDSVCEQCHLEGATVVLNPGKYWWDFQAGRSLEAVEAHYVYRSRINDQLSIAAVSQAEQLALSSCFRHSAGRLWCGTCHDPHGDPVDRKQQMRQICETCHPPAQLAATHTASQIDCVTCHMPRRQATDIAHAAVTDHRIVARPTPPIDPAEAPFLTSWHEPEPDSVQRDLGLAHFYTAKRGGSEIEFRTAYEILTGLPPTPRDDTVLAARGYILLDSGQLNAAVDCFEQATRINPASAEYWLDLGVAQQASGKVNDAVSAFRRSIVAAPYDYRPYQALARLYAQMREPAQARSVTESFLRLVPESIVMRLQQ